MTERDPDPTTTDVPEDPGEPTDTGDDDAGEPDVKNDPVPESTDG